GKDGDDPESGLARRPPGSPGSAPRGCLAGSPATQGARSSSPSSPLHRGPTRLRRGPRTQPARCRGQALQPSENSEIATPRELTTLILPEGAAKTWQPHGIEVQVPAARSASLAPGT